MWHRVFSKADTAPSAAAILAHLQEQGVTVTAEFRGDDLGWTSGQFVLPKGGSPVILERYLTDADDLRNDLNSWAGWLETADYSPNHQWLMEHVIQTRQLFTLRRPIDHPDEIALDRLCEGLCRYLAGLTEGVYQADGQGFFAASGELILQEY